MADADATVMQYLEAAPEVKGSAPQRCYAWMLRTMRGLTKREAAAQMELAEKTVENHCRLLRRDAERWSGRMAVGSTSPV